MIFIIITIIIIIIIIFIIIIIIIIIIINSGAPLLGLPKSIYYHFGLLNQRSSNPTKGVFLIPLGRSLVAKRKIPT